MAKNRIIGKVLGRIIFIVFSFILTSCITDEFRIGDLKVKEDFKTDLIVPMFAGNLEFSEFLDLNGNTGSGLNNSFSVLKYSNGSTVKISNRIIFEPRILLSNFPFVIQGSYELTSITIEFRISNGTPFPLNLKLRHFEKTNPKNLGPPIQPLPFVEVFNNITDNPEIHQVQLDDEQRKSFMDGNRIQFTTWFDETDFINENDTLNANYPVNISVIMLGEVKAKNEDK